MSWEPPATYISTQTQPWTNPSINEPPGSVADNGITIRTLRDTPEDAEFAASLSVEAFRGKIAYNITERKLPIAVKNMTAAHRGQADGFYKRVFVAELQGRPVGLLHLQFKGDTELEPDDHISELGCWHAFRYVCFGYMVSSDVDKRYKCYLDHICVDDSARGKGVGKVLIQRAEYEAKIRNCSIIFLYVMTDNRARNLYERQGYRVTKTESCCGCLGCFIGPPGKVYEMEKNI